MSTLINPVVTAYSFVPAVRVWLVEPYAKCHSLSLVKISLCELFTASFTNACTPLAALNSEEVISTSFNLLNVSFATVKNVYAIY